MKIYAVHLLNDYSGSPKVLMQLLKGWTYARKEVVVVTASGSEGFLSNIPGASYLTYWYKWARNPWTRLITYFISQTHLFARLLFTLKKHDIVYVNTVLPFGAAMAGKLLGCRVIYHIHETSVTPKILKAFLFGLIRFTSNDIVYVSRYLAEQEPVVGPKCYVLYNAIEGSFLNTAKRDISKKSLPRNILMVCSLKAYKGVQEYWNLASALPELSFKLVINAHADAIREFVADRSVPQNLTIYPTQTDVHPYYHRADIVLNLSRTDQWVETFGLTIIEGMAYGLPSIVPPVGGIAELVTEGMTGYHVDSMDAQLLKMKLIELCDPGTYDKMREKVFAMVSTYDEITFWNRSLDILEGSAIGRSSIKWNLLR